MKRRNRESRARMQIIQEQQTPSKGWTGLGRYATHWMPLPEPPEEVEG